MSEPKEFYEEGAVLPGFLVPAEESGHLSIWWQDSEGEVQRAVLKPAGEKDRWKIARGRAPRNTWPPLPMPESYTFTLDGFRA